MKTTKILAILVLALGLMVCTAELARAAPLGTAFTYQGRLIDANQPADGLYDFQFKLFDDANTVTGNQVGSDFNTPDVDVIDGYFTVELDFGPDIFTGHARWLEMEVRPGDSNDVFTTLSPRQELTPVPYALGVRVPLKLEGAIDDASAIEARNSVLYPSSTQVTSSFEAAHASDGWMSFGVKGSDIATGVPPDFPDSRRYGGYFTAESVPGSDCGGEDPRCTSAYGVYGRATGADYSYGGYFESDHRAVLGKNSIFENWGALGYGAGYGVYGSNPVATAGATGVYGEATYAGNVTNYGGYFKADGSTGRGVYGEASNAGSGPNYGGYFTSAGIYGRGVRGKATGTNGRGVYGEASGISGEGVHGYASNAGDVTNHGGYFTAAGKYGRGVRGRATGTNGRGVYGEATATGDLQNYGGYFAAAGYDGVAVYGAATATISVVNGQNENYGGYFTAAGPQGRGVYGEATATIGTNFGVYGKTNSPDGYAGYFQGRVAATKGVEMPLTYYEVTATSTTPRTVTTAVHNFCALTKVSLQTGDAGTYKYFQVVRNANGTWTLTARGGSGTSVTAGCQCF